MAKGKLSEDTVRFILEADSSQAQQEIHKTNKSIESLGQRRKSLLEQQAAMQRARLTETKEYKALSREIKANEQAIANENVKLQELYKKLGTGSMTMTQLRKEAKNLQRQLDGTSKALQPELYKQYADKLAEVKTRMSELRGTTEQVKGSFGGSFLKSLFGASLDFSSIKSFIAGSGIFAAITFITEQVSKIAKAAFEKIKWFYDFNVEVEEARRLTKEFFNLTGEKLTQVQSQISAVAKQLGKDYKDVLSSVDTLMNQYDISATQALDHIKDGIQAGADENGTFLSQIQQYAPAFHDAGVYVGDFVALITQTRSGIFNQQGMQLIQTATNRIRTMSTATQQALDGIGISSKQLEKDLVSGKTSILQAVQMISAKIKELPENSMQVGEVMKSVFGKTASNEGMKLVQMLADISTNMDDLKGVTGEYGRLQREQIETQAEFNEKLTETFGIGQGGFKEMTLKAEMFILRGLIKTIDYCKSLYDELGVVRAAVEFVRIAFDFAFKFIGFGFYTIIDIVKLMAKAVRGLANLIEGAFTFDFAQVKQGWNQVWDGIGDSIEEIIKDAKDFGSKWGNNALEGIKRAMKKGKIQTPDVEGTTLPEVTITGKRKGGTNFGNNNKNNSKHADPDSIASRNFANDRRQDIDEARRAYTEDLNALKQALAEKRITQEQYNAYVSALNIQHQNNLLSIEQSYQQRSENMQFKDANKKKELLQQQNKAVADQKLIANEAYIAAEQQYGDILKRLQDASAATGQQTLQQELDAKLLMLESYYKASLQLAEGDEAKQTQVTEAYQKARIAITAEYARKQADLHAQARQEYGLDTLDDQLAARRKKIDDDLAKGVISQQEHQQALENLELQSEQHKLQIRRQYGLASQQDLYNAELEQLKMHLQNKELSQQEYEEAVKNLKIEKAKEAFDYYANLAGGAVKALQDAEMDNVDAKYDAEIEAAKNAGKDTTEIEKKKADEKLKIQKKYADVDFAMQAAQIISSTAVAIMGAWATFKGNPITASLATALIAATSAAQLAAANAERQKVKKLTLSGTSSASASGTRVATGLESGGSIDVERQQDGRRFHAAYDPDKRGYVDRPTVIVGEGGYGHSKEWVASNAAVENPTVAPIIDIIDRAQRAGSIRTLDMNKFLFQQTQGRASGGSITPSMQDVQPVAHDSYKDSLIERFYTLLSRIEENGIPAAVTLDELEQKQKLRDRARRIGSK